MKLNKYFAVFIGLFVGFNAILVIVFQKYFLLLLHHTIYYCQEMAKTLSLRLPGNTGLVVFTLLSGILAITVFKLIITAIKIFRLKKSLSNNIGENDNISSLLRRLNLQNRVLIIDSSRPFALCFGLINPKIYVSTKLTNLLSRDELEVVLRHEKYHLENRDTLILMLATIFESLLPFFPLISDLIRQYKIERELSADRAASYDQGDKHLTSALTKLLQYEPQVAFVAAPAIADADTLEVRIKRLMNKRYFYKRFTWKNFFISFASVGFLLTLALTPVNAVELHNEKHDVVFVCTQVHACESVCKNFKSPMQITAPLYTPVSPIP